jgi:hypothetical protein
MASNPSFWDGANIAPAPSLEGEPYPEIGTAESLILTGFGLEEKDGKWFTESGGEVESKKLAVLLGQGNV